jgi:translation initiation factor 2B subunit (eIF-2B alpha/beta/delta family)
MDATLVKTLNSQLLALENDYGSDAIGPIVVHALIRTIDTYTGDTSVQGLTHELLRLHDALLDCRPRMAGLILEVQSALLFLHEHPQATLPQLCEFLDGLLDTKQSRQRISIKVANELLRDQPTILLHAYSDTLRAILEQCAERDQRPRVFVAAQEEEKTDRLVSVLHRSHYDYKVVSEYSIAHIVEQLDLAIFPALTLNNSGQAVLGPGSTGLVSQLRAVGVKTYMFLTTNKFSFWTDDTETAFSEVREKKRGALHFQKTVFSHDDIALDQFTGVITESAILSPADTRALFSELQEKWLANERLLATLRNGSGSR